MNLSSSVSSARPSIPSPIPAATPASAPTASERILAAELEARGDAHDALSMMVSSIARMVQAGRTRDSRWKDA